VDLTWAVGKEKLGWTGHYAVAAPFFATPAGAEPAFLDRCLVVGLFLFPPSNYFQPLAFLSRQVSPLLVLVNHEPLRGFRAFCCSSAGLAVCTC